MDKYCQLIITNQAIVTDQLGIDTLQIVKLKNSVVTLLGYFGAVAIHTLVIHQQQTQHTQRSPTESNARIHSSAHI